MLAEWIRNRSGPCLLRETAIHRTVSSLAARLPSATHRPSVLPMFFRDVLQEHAQPPGTSSAD